MNSSDELRQENAALRERIKRLSVAILRISASLDLDTVLNEVVDSARALTGARYGMIATVDEGGAIQEFIASGLSADERRHMADWPHGYQFFEGADDYKQGWPTVSDRIRHEHRICSRLQSRGRTKLRSSV